MGRWGDKDDEVAQGLYRSVEDDRKYEGRWKKDMKAGERWYEKGGGEVDM